MENQVEISYLENKIMIKGLEIKDGHLDSIRQNLIVFIQTLN